MLGRLAQAGVDHLHARVAQRARDDLSAAVVAIEARLGDDDSELSHIQGLGLGLGARGSSGCRDQLQPSPWSQSLSPR